VLTLLDESTARVKTLVAPAGYGKTTAAEQWVAKAGRRGVWYRARRASTDVAGLALGVARACSEIVGGCDERLREHLRAVPSSGAHVALLAEILGEDLADWPSEAWLVLDEYQELARSSEAEHFVAELVAACPVQLLIATRQRPAWVTARGILYGEVLELTQFALAMDNREAAEVLGDRTGPSASGLVALANGWPAVIGLASVSSAEIDGEDPVPESLYRFFAEEVFDALGSGVREGLAALAVAPLLDRELAGELLGEDHVDSVCAAALDVGILEERGPQLELHPLARSFLDGRSGHPLAEPEAKVGICLRRYRARRDWDAAFDLVSRRGLERELEPLLRDALDDLLSSARLSTIEDWCALATSFGINAPIVSVARAEISLRQGRHSEAQSFAESAAAEASDVSFRALSVAGRAAHLASREQEALALYKRAEAAAATETNRRDALWGQLICAAELELPEATATLGRLSAGVRASDPRDAVRAAAYTLMYQLRMASLDLTEADTAIEFLGTIDDPLVKSAFQSAYANALALSARYDEALQVAATLIDTAQRYRLDFALPYGHCWAGLAHTGLRQWSRARACLLDGARAAQDSGNLHAEQNCYSAVVRCLAQQGKATAALLLPIPKFVSSMPAIRAEVLTSRGLALAAAGRLRDALDTTEEVHGMSRALEPIVLSKAIEAVCALKSRNRDAGARITSLEDAAFESGAVDLLVAAYRSTPELLAMLLRTSSKRDRLVRLLHLAGDDDLADALGESLSPADPRERLSPREREVYGLLCEGLSNRQIAEALYISESTVKLHAHHIYDKLGTRSRTALAIQAALERSDQATSATGSSGSASTP
jgi:ATP/maltotriose-dependent transcriptional regulator MalT